MTVPFAHEFRAQWGDMDFNQHMANTAFLDYASTTRFLFFDSVGLTADVFAERRLGPVILEDRIVYRREIRLLETFTVDLQATAGTTDGRRFGLRNRFTSASESLCATVDSIGLWFDLDARRPVRPPQDLLEAFGTLARSEDYQEWVRPPR